MELLIVLVVSWVIAASLLLRARYGKTIDGWARDIAFRPSEKVSADDLFGYLLSANLAVLEHDNFNQLGSALGKKRVGSVLALQWGVTTKSECLRVVERRLYWMGVASPAEEAAYTAWRNGMVIETEDYEALYETCRFLAKEACIVQAPQIKGVHLTPLAWDIQQLAYIVRLGFAAGYMSREHATEILARLKQAARFHYNSWQEFSLSALIGMGVRSPIDPFDLRDWHKIARTHTVLIAASNATLANASSWAERPVARGLAEASMASLARLN
ncbi:MAG: DUF1266 domain-containing protein [Variovorax sp.]